DGTDLFSNAMLQPFNNASNSLCTQSDGRLRSDFFGAHSLAEVEPENHAVAFLVGRGQAALQVIVNLIQKDSESDLFLAPMNLFPRFKINITCGYMRFGAAG